jgi:hypothetical protein
MNHVRLQGVLKPEYHGTPDDQKILGALASLQMSYTGGGHATVSAEMGTEHFEQCFGPRASSGTEERLTPTLGPADGRLPVPEALRPYFDSIAVQPQHLQFQSEL